jgi:PII-like signaling protein
MELNGKAILLRIFMGDSDRIHGKCLYEAIIEEAQKAGLAGATAYRGIESFGASHSIHTMKIWALSDDLPVIVDIVDKKEQIENFLPLLHELMDRSGKGGLVITEEVDVRRYQRGNKYKNKTEV